MYSTENSGLTFRLCRLTNEAYFVLFQDFQHWITGARSRIWYFFGDSSHRTGYGLTDRLGLWNEARRLKTHFAAIRPRALGKPRPLPQFPPNDVQLRLAGP